MNAPLPLQERILAVLTQHAVSAKDIEHALPGCDRNGIDHALNGLMRQNRVTLALGMYDLVRTERRDFTNMKRREERAPAIPQRNFARVEAPSSTAEQASASPAPRAEETAICADCGPKPTSHFQHSKLGTPFKVCITCASLRASRGLRIAHSRKRLERSEGNPSSTVQSKLGSGIPAETSGSTNENPPSNSRLPMADKAYGVRVESAAPERTLTDTTPAPPVGSTEPPVASSEQPSTPAVHGTQFSDVVTENPEALPPVGAGTNTQMEASAVSPRTSPESYPPPVADDTGGRAPPSKAAMLVQLAAKRRRWVLEVAALQVAIKSVDELVIALQALEEV